LGCSPQQRIARIAEKYNLKTWETLVYKDTVYIPSKTYTFEAQLDTLGFFYQEKDGNEVVGKVKDNFVYVNLTTKPDTVYIEKPINIETIKVQTIQKSKGIRWGKIIGVCIAFGFLLISGKYFLRILKSKV